MGRPSGRGGPALGFLQEPVRQGFGVWGEVHQADLGRAQVGSHPLGGEAGAQAGVEAEAIPTSQGALDQRPKLVPKAFGNEVFGQRALQEDLSPRGGRVPTPDFLWPSNVGGLNLRQGRNQNRTAGSRDVRS